VNLATAFLAAAVVALFEDIIAKITVLAVFLPVVAGQGGNAGAQSLAIVMRGLVMREIPKDKVKRLILKETWLGAVSGTVTGLVTALVAWAWDGNPWLGLVIGLAMIVNLLAAGMSGAAIPILMKTVGLDPAQCSSIILTTVTDVIGFFAFLGFAVVFQSHLIYPMEIRTQGTKLTGPAGRCSSSVPGGWFCYDD
jgi:magnesium transporter